MWTFRKFSLQPVLVKSGWIWKDTQGDDWPADTWYLLLLMLLCCYSISLFVHLFQPHWWWYIISHSHVRGRNFLQDPWVHRYQTYWDPNHNKSSVAHRIYKVGFCCKRSYQESKRLFICVFHCWGMLSANLNIFRTMTFNKGIVGLPVFLAPVWHWCLSSENEHKASRCLCVDPYCLMWHVYLHLSWTEIIKILQDHFTTVL